MAQQLNWTYDLGTVLGQVRLKIGDTNLSVTGDPDRSKWSCVFADEELNVFIGDVGGVVDFAAAMALRFMSVTPQFMIQSLNIMGLDMSLGDYSKRLLEAANQIMEGRASIPAEVFAEVDGNDFQARTIWRNRLLQSGNP